MASEILNKAREYERHMEAFIKEEDRPDFHLTPRVGWMNDPNGFCRYGGKYHMFYQYHPYSLQWGPMHWGHAVSEDMIHWEYLPVAIGPDEGYDKDGCFSGSAIELPDGRHLLMYTGVERKDAGDGIIRDFQTQCVAIGDGVDYEKADCNPVITADQIPEGFSIYDFRDPKIYREPDGRYACVVGNRTGDGSGAILLYRSTDCLHWEYQTVLDRSYNEYGRMWECPDFFELDGKQILLTSPQDMVSLGYEFHNGNNAICVFGSYDPATDEFSREGVQEVDYGLDFYAPQTVVTPDGRRVMIGWMQNWDCCFVPAEPARWFGQMTCPRELSFQNGRLLQNPIRELENYRGRRIAYSDVPLEEEMTLPGVYGRRVDMTVTIPAQEYEHFRIKVARGSQHYTSISYRPETATLRLSRNHSGLYRDFVHRRECLVKDQGGAIKLRILLDRNSVEVFVNDGEQAMTTTIYTPETANGITFESRTKMYFSVEKYEILR